ncbi:MAG: sigma factor-like helix-turn-helix DNA-binding protein [Solirubrobacteraceae bacterium]
MLVSLSHDRRRAARRRPLTAPEHLAFDRPAIDQVSRLLDRDAITRAAGHLPASQQEVLACRFLLDLAVAETAETLKLPEGTVKSYTARALAGMRELLTDDPAVVPGEPSEVRDAD